MSNAIIPTFIIEDDPYAADMMFMLLSRDYRTRVITELSSEFKLDEIDNLGKSGHATFNEDTEVDVRPNVIILDTEVPRNPDFPFLVAERVAAWSTPPRIIFTSSHPDEHTIERISKYNSFAGCNYSAESVDSLSFLQRKSYISQVRHDRSITFLFSGSACAA